MTMIPRFHTFGDSHAEAGWNKIPGITTHEIGPVLCYSFGRDKLSRLDISKYGFSDGDTACFCFGEIDCRGHVHKHVSHYKSYQSIIEGIVSNYFDAIQTNMTRYPSSKVCVYNVVPPMKFVTNEGRMYPFVGNDEERSTYVTYFNSLLKAGCLERGYTFIDVYDCYTDGDGLLNPTLSDGYMHIRDESHLRKFLQDNRLI